MEQITVKEYAELKGCSVRYVQKCISNGKLEAALVVSADNNCMQYMIPVSALPADIMQAYCSRRGQAAEQYLTAAPAEKKPPAVKRERTKRDFGSFSAEEREVIAFWTEIIREWQVRRLEYSSAEEGDAVFIAEVGRLRRDFLEKHGLNISRDILYRKYRYYKEDDLEGLTECRGGYNQGCSSIPDELSQVFNDLYLCDRKIPVSDCYRLTVEWARENRPEYIACMPSERTFRRAVGKLPEAVVKYFRMSRKECIDDCLPYIIRLYDSIEANDVWVADNHTFDFMTRTDEGAKPHRMYITGILDAKTGVLVGWNITENPSSQSTVLAIRHAIMRCGVPNILYVDNGREFLTHDIGGKGHRSRKSQENIPAPPTILERLGIKMLNAIPENGRAKPIERMFLTLKNTISRLFETFTGGTVIERPESLRWQLKHGYVPYDRQMIEKMDILLDGYNGSPYGGCEKQFEGMTRAEAWCRSIRRRTLRMCGELTLNLLLMRSSRYQTVRENGVYVTVSGEKLWYSSGEDNWRFEGREVYVRYDPADMERVMIYDKSDTYIGDWFLDMGVYADYITVNNEDIANRNRLRARQIRAIREARSELTGDMQIDALALAVAEAHRKSGDVTFTPPAQIESVTAHGLPKAAGAEDIDLELMVKGAMEHKDNYDNIFREE